MDKTIIISLVVISAVTLVELGCLFMCSRLRVKSYPVAAVVPIFTGCTELPQLLDYYGTLLSNDSAVIDRLYFIVYTAESDSIEQCNEFCRAFSRASVIMPDELENAISGVFSELNVWDK